MTPILPHRSCGQCADRDRNVHRRLAEEQDFYETFGSSSIIRFFSFIQSVHELLNLPNRVFDRVKAASSKQNPVPKPSRN